jgi:hypothetical protein
LVQVRPEEADESVATLEPRVGRQCQECEKRQRFGLREDGTGAWRGAAQLDAAEKTQLDRRARDVLVHARNG